MRWARMTTARAAGSDLYATNCTERPPSVHVATDSARCVSCSSVSCWSATDVQPALAASCDAVDPELSRGPFGVEAVDEVGFVVPVGRVVAVDRAEAAPD